MKKSHKRRSKIVKQKNFMGFAMSSYIVLIVGIIISLGLLTLKNNLNQVISPVISPFPSMAFPSINIVPSGSNINISSGSNSSVVCLNGVCHTCDSQNSSCAINCANDKCTCSTGACIEITPPQTTP